MGQKVNLNLKQNGDPQGAEADREGDGFTAFYNSKLKALNKTDFSASNLTVAESPDRIVLKRSNLTYKQLENNVWLFSNQ